MIKQEELNDTNHERRLAGLPSLSRYYKIEDALTAAANGALAAVYHGCVLCLAMLSCVTYSRRVGQCFQYVVFCCRPKTVEDFKKKR